MVRACAITDKGLEKIALLEVEELLGVRGRAEERVVIFNCKSFQDLFKFCYMSQSVERVLLLFSDFKFRDYDELLAKAEAAFKKSVLNEWFEKDKSFRVECKRIGEHAFGSQAVEKSLGKKIIFKVKKEVGFMLRASMESPELTIYVFINNNKAYVGVDLIGRDLSKRQYRVFSAPGMINANLAYAIIRLSNYSPRERLVNVLCKEGVVCIEAALYASGLSINYYSKDFAFKKLKPFENKDWDEFFKKIDSKRKKLSKLNILGLDPLLRNVEAAKKNSKLAGADKIISFSKMSIEWLDTKLDKESVDIIVSRLPCPSKHTSEAAMKTLYKELFYQAEFVMKKGGKLVFLTEHAWLLKKMLPPKFKLVKEDELWAGKQKYEVIIINKL